MSGRSEDEREQAERFRSSLAEELRELIRSLEADGDLTREAAEEPARERQPSSTDISRLADQIAELHASIEEADAELILAVRLLRSFVRASITELSDQLVETEHSLREEIRRLESQLRSDIAALRSVVESPGHGPPRDSPRSDD